MSRFTRILGIEYEKSVTVDTNVYAAGDLLCAKIEIPVTRDIFLNKIIVTDLSKQDAELDFIFFDSDPSSTTFTLNGAFDIADADLTKITGTFTVSPAHYYDYADNSAAHLYCNDTFLRCKDGDKIYCAVVCRGTPTYSTANDLKFRFGYYEA